MIAGEAPDAAPAPGTIQVSWNDCDPVVESLCLEEDGQVARLYVSVTGVTEPCYGTRVKFQIGGCVDLLGGSPASAPSSFPDAWRFDYSGCNKGYLQVDGVENGTDCPYLMEQEATTLWNYSYDGQESAILDMLNGYLEAPVLSGPDPSTRYLLFRVSFDFSHSVCGTDDSGEACGGLEQAKCIHLFYTEFIRPDFSSVEFYIEPEDRRRDWQWNSCDQHICLVQNHSSTWGRVKGLYR